MTNRAGRNRWTMVLCALMCIAFLNSCDTLRNFINRDLEEEDYTMGELYVDEYVNETPYVPTPSSDAKREGRVNALGIEREEGDNEELYTAVQDWIGTPYKYGGNDKNGVDCSAFVGHIYRMVYGQQLHRVANDIQKDTRPLSRSQLQEGDIVFFTNSKGKVSHVGIYLKNGLFAHASTSRGVIISRLDEGYWKQHFHKGGRVRK